MSANPSTQSGVAYARTEDHRLITGQGQYTADVQYPGMLHLHVIRSMHAHARILRLDLSAVAAAPGVRWVMTAQDIEANGGQDLPNAVSVKDRHGEPQRVVRMPVLAHDTVRFVGQPIAFVIADTPYQAQDAAELADIEFDILPAAASIEAALAAGRRPTPRQPKLRRILSPTRFQNNNKIRACAATPAVAVAAISETWSAPHSAAARWPVGSAPKIAM